ncbi:hypothetical protein GW17_00008280, partial [Ensete ventricosum]
VVHLQQSSAAEPITQSPSHPSTVSPRDEDARVTRSRSFLSSYTPGVDLVSLYLRLGAEERGFAERSQHLWMSSSPLLSRKGRDQQRYDNQRRLVAGYENQLRLLVC